MSTWTARRLAWGIGVLSLVLMAATLVLMFVDRGADLPENVGSWGPNDVFDVLVTLGVPVLGVVIVNKQPKNAIGWLFLVVGASIALSPFGQVYALHTLLADPGSLPAGRALAWVSNVLWPIPIAGLICLFLLFPTGHPVTPGWRIVGWFTIALLVVLMTGSVIIATAIWSDPFQDVLDVEGGAGIDAAKVAILIAALAGIVALFLALVSVVIRYRHSTGTERLQLKWFVSAAVVTAVVFTVSFFYDSPVVAVLVSVSLLGLWVAIGIAMVKHNLFDIDLILNKAIAYGALAVIFTGVYVLVVVVIGAVIGVTEGLSLVATAIVAVAFQPLRERAQHFANRLVYGERATPYEVLSRFSEQVGETYSGEDIHVRMVRLLAEGTGATSAAVWLKVGEEYRPVATWPTNGLPAPVRAVGGQTPEFEGATTSVPVKHRGEQLGMLSLVKPPNEPLTPVEQTLVNDLAGQAALLLANSRLIEDLRASRQRLVTAQDAERRRLERNLHDGAQQQLVALGVQLGLAQRVAKKEAPEVAETLERLQAQTTDALENLRDLARGVYPPLLADQGLVAAIEAQARRSPVAVRVESDGIRRYAQEVETAVYFCTLEALQNAAKYARADQVVVRLEERDGELVFEIEDEGQGFDQATTTFGSGLQNMADRLAALGGELLVRSGPGRGTLVEGHISVRSGVAPSPAST
ncbi:MAG TPA: sensor histidine kinase [Actinomycetota bacterium]|nr:sensor histidine kinase [Actinomycetota bacterium]